MDFSGSDNVKSESGKTLLPRSFLHIEGICFGGAGCKTNLLKNSVNSKQNYNSIHTHTHIYIVCFSELKAVQQTVIHSAPCCATREARGTDKTPNRIYLIYKNNNKKIRQICWLHESMQIYSQSSKD